MRAIVADSSLTVRVPRSWAGRVTASFVRESIRRYLANPARLPQYGGSLEVRVSWRLLEDDLQRIGRGGDRGDMIRRIVAAALRSGGSLPLPAQKTAPTQPNDTDIVSEELVGEDANGGVIILQRDRRGFGYQRTLPIDRETYLKAGHR